jgi:hypothetical protein
VRLTTRRRQRGAPGSRARSTGSLEKGKFTEPEHEAALGRLSVIADLSLQADRDLVMDAATEVPEVKAALLRTSTGRSSAPTPSSRPGRPAQFIGLHFFNPAPVQKVVEAIPSILTGQTTGDRARARVTGVLGKTAISALDQPGSVVNTLLVPYLLAAIRMVESGHATASDVGAGMELGCVHPMRPRLHAAHIPESYGGEGADALAAVIIIEAVARVCASSSLTPTVNKLGTVPLLLSGSEDLKRKYLPPVVCGHALFSNALSEAGRHGPPPTSAAARSALATRPKADGSAIGSAERRLR